jgi:hypothetical protein
MSRIRTAKRSKRHDLPTPESPINCLGEGETNVSKRTSSRDFLEMRARVESRRARDRAVTGRQARRGRTRSLKR